MTYSLIEVFNEIVKEYLAPYFKSKGFKKQNLNFYKAENEVIFLINFQKSMSNSVDYVRFYINCGIYSAEVIRTNGDRVLPNPKEYECLFNARFERITGSEKQEFELTLSGENVKKALANDVIIELEKVLDFYKIIKNNDDLVDVCIERGTYFWRELFTYLSIKKDLKRLGKYVQNYSDIFKGDSRRQWFETEINVILKDYGIEPMLFKAE
jgi:Domain of unknown function (DUF4304)